MSNDRGYFSGMIHQDDIEVTMDEQATFVDLEEGEVRRIPHGSAVPLWKGGKWIALFGERGGHSYVRGPARVGEPMPFEEILCKLRASSGQEAFAHMTAEDLRLIENDDRIFRAWHVAAYSSVALIVVTIVYVMVAIAANVTLENPHAGYDLLRYMCYVVLAMIIGKLVMRRPARDLRNLGLATRKRLSNLMQGARLTPRSGYVDWKNQVNK